MILDPPRYLSAEDARMRLSGSIVRFGQIPVFVEVIEHFPERIAAFVFPLDQNDDLPDVIRADGIDVNDDRLDIASPPLGYVNHNKTQLYWLYRTPGRQQKQGLTIENTLIRADDGDNRDDPPDLPSGRRNLLMVSNYALSNTIKGNFPSLQDAINKMQNPDIQGVAFDRAWAIVRHNNTPDVLRLKYLRQTIGFMSEGQNPDVVLLPGFRKIPGVKKLLARWNLNFTNLERPEHALAE